jgi:hypothetical protein
MADQADSRLPIVLGTLTLVAMLLVGALLFFYIVAGPAPQPLPRPETPASDSPAAQLPDAIEDAPREAPVEADPEPDPRPAPTPETRPDRPQPVVDDHDILPPVPPEYRPRPVIERELPDGTIERVEHPPDLSGETRQVHRDLELTARLLQDALR